MLSADPLSEVLSLLGAKSVLSASLRAGGDWSIRFPSEGVKFNAVVEGSCFLRQEASDTLIRLEAGDCFLLTNCGSYVLCSNPRLTPVEARGIFSQAKAGAVSHGDVDGSCDVFVIGGRIDLDEADASLLLDALPPIFYIGGQSREAPAIRWFLTRLRDEGGASLPGGALAADHLAQLLFVEVIRAWLHSDNGPTTGWLHAIGDRRVGAAMRLMHADPARPWRLQDLAEVAGMSRSNFALQFKQLAGLAPLDYLLRWRMRLGAKALRLGAEPISAISFSLGYQSESAFSNAFKRVMGIAPQQYRRDCHRRNLLADAVAG
jgi:AraC-like DNA-binding protein